MDRTGGGGAFEDHPPGICEIISIRVQAPASDESPHPLGNK